MKGAGLPLLHVSSSDLLAVKTPRREQNTIRRSQTLRLDLDLSELPTFCQAHQFLLAASDSGSMRGLGVRQGSCDPVKVTRPELLIEASILRT